MKPLNNKKNVTSGVVNQSSGLRQAQQCCRFLYIKIVLCQQTRQMKFQLWTFLFALFSTNNVVTYKTEIIANV